MMMSFVERFEVKQGCLPEMQCLGEEKEPQSVDLIILSSFVVWVFYSIENGFGLFHDLDHEFS